MDKAKLTVFGIIGGVMVAMIVYSVLVFGGKKREIDRDFSFESPTISVEEKKQDYNSRIDALTKGRYEKPKRDNPLRYDFLGEKKEVEEIKEKKEITEQTKKATANQYKRIERKEKPKTVSALKKTQTQSVQPVKQQETHVEVIYGFSEGHGTTTTNELTETSEINIWAQLDEKAVVSENSHQIFLLEQSAVIGGRRFPANSKLYTRATVERDYIDIEVNRIKDINTFKEYSVTMYAVNEDRSRGLKYKGKVNRESDNASNDVLKEVTRSISRRYHAEGITDAIGDGAEDISERDRVEVSVGKGYRLIFIETQ